MRPHVAGLHRSYGSVRPSAPPRYSRLVVVATCASPLSSERLVPAVPHESLCTATNTLDTELGYGLVVPGCRLPTLGHDATVLGPVKHMPLSRGPAALLDRPCARRPADGQVGTAGWSAFGRTSGWIMRPPFAG